MSIFAELKRRNVIKVAAAYIIVGWLIMQAGEVMTPALRLPDWVLSTLAFFLILGFPLALIFAWAFEMTPEGLKLEKDVQREESITPATGRKLDFIIIGLMTVALAYFAYDKFVLGRTAPSTSAETAQVESEPSAETETAAPPAKANAIAVLPFVNMSSDPEQEFFSDGITEELLNLLAKIPELQVTSRSSAFSFKGQVPDIPTVAAKLGVAHVLEGSVRKAGNKVRITAQLIEASSDTHLWSESYDRELDDVFAVQDEIAGHVVAALQVKLLGDLPTAATTDTEAYTLYLKGRHLDDLATTESRQASEAAFRAALEIDPDYALAWAGLSTNLSNQANMGELDGVDFEATNEAARAAAIRAVEQDPTLADAWAALSNIKLVYDWDWSGAHGDARTALQYGPRSTDPLRNAAGVARSLGLMEEAIEYAELATELDPLDRGALRSLSITYYFANRYADGEAVLRRILELYPEAETESAFLAWNISAQGRPEEALQFLDSDTRNFWHWTALAHVHQWLGQIEESDRYLELLKAGWGDSGAFQMTEIYAARGEIDHAFEWLDIAYRSRDGGFTQILVNPLLVNLHEDPRWEQVLDLVGLLPYWREMNGAPGS